jgi:hypothetical protein
VTKELLKVILKPQSTFTHLGRTLGAKASDRLNDAPDRERELIPQSTEGAGSVFAVITGLPRVSMNDSARARDGLSNKAHAIDTRKLRVAANRNHTRTLHCIITREAPKFVVQGN